MQKATTMSTQPVPERIRRVFGVPEGDVVPEPGTAARWRIGDIVCSRVADATVGSLQAVLLVVVAAAVAAILWTRLADHRAARRR